MNVLLPTAFLIWDFFMLIFGLIGSDPNAQIAGFVVLGIAGFCMISFIVMGLLYKTVIITWPHDHDTLLSQWTLGEIMIL